MLWYTVHLSFSICHLNSTCSLKVSISIPTLCHTLYIVPCTVTEFTWSTWLHVKIFYVRNVMEKMSNVWHKYGLKDLWWNWRDSRRERKKWLPCVPISELVSDFRRRIKNIATQTFFAPLSEKIKNKMEKEKVKKNSLLHFIPIDCWQKEHRVWEFTQLYIRLRLDPVATQRQGVGGCHALATRDGASQDPRQRSKRHSAESWCQQHFCTTV